MSTTPSVRRSTCTPERRGVVADGAGCGERTPARPPDRAAGAASGGIDAEVDVGTASGDAVGSSGRIADRSGRDRRAGAPHRAAPAGRRRRDRRRLPSCLLSAHPRDEPLPAELALVHRGRHRQELCGRGNPHVEPAHIAARRREGAEARRAPRGVDELGRIGGPASCSRAHLLRGIGRSCAHSATRAPSIVGPSTAPVRGPVLGSARASQRAPCPCSRLSWVHPCCRMLRRARAGESTS